MRKKLLASAAVMSGLLYTGGAFAQSVTSPALLPDARAMAGGVNPADSALPAPGSVVVRFGGQIDWYAATFSDSADHSEPGSATVSKEAHYSFGDYIRLFPSVDGVAANGLRYGAFVELRVENYEGTGGGANGSVSGIDRSNTLYVRRAWGYLGLANLGTIRFGTGDGAGGLFDTGTFQNFDAGGWNGDIPNLIDGNIQSTFPFQGGVGAFYATDKLTYLSPQVMGLEFGLSYEPNTSNVTDYNAGSNSSTLATLPPGVAAGGGLSSIAANGSSIAGDLARRRNVINPELRYRNTFGPLGVALEYGYYKSASLGYEGIPTSATVKYKGWDFNDAGVVLTFGGLSVGGHIMSGAFSGQGVLEPQGERDSFAWIGGASYTVGPVIVGGSVFNYNFNGHQNQTNRLTVGGETDLGVAAGGTYTITPGVSLFLSYVYGTKKESGYDFVGGAAGTLNNKVRSEALGTGLQVKW